ncbi:G-type lectin S-receptor-like serine/threonine-protein kinase [Glycine max]|nr:G-type lectin S-receptor-like serine/threonine-protein kinase [Glycine max]
MEIFSVVIFIVSYMLVPSLKISAATLDVSQYVTDGETLVSNSGVFELGFFSPGKSTKRYLGIWYKNITSDRAVWVANRENPINDSSGILTFSTTGNLELRQNDSVVWSTNYKKQAQNPVAELLDTGNFVVRNEGDTDPETYSWQSFDYPSDTLLPGMKLGWDLRTGLERKLTSWKSPDDPSAGDFSWGLMLHNYPEFYLMIGTHKYYRTGPWNGLHFSGSSNRTLNPLYEFKYVTTNDLIYASNKVEMFYSFSLKNSSIVMIVNINETLSQIQTQVWSEDGQIWVIYETTPGDYCDVYAVCGPNANCRITEPPVCQCLKGFKPKPPQEWIPSMDWSQGCVRPKPLSCEEIDYMDHFVKYVGLKVPDTTYTWLDENINLEECRIKCFNNCSCMAFSNSDIRGGGSGCVLWFGDLIDIRQYPTGEQDLYIRMPAMESINQQEHGHNSVKIIIATTIAGISGILSFCIFVIYRVRRSIADKFKTKENIERQLKDLDLPLFDLLTITTATYNFSSNSKIGHGAFGPVYKGKLADGQEIAVKRLSSSSGQGITEFVTEVKLIAKLQHRNLVKLLGFCIKRQEKILVYEYMAWTLWKEQNVLQLIDSSIKDSCVIPEVLRCIHVSLLCVQQYPEDRPSMTLVIQMLGSETDLIEPKEPGFFPRRFSDEGNLSTIPNHMSSNEELTITSLNGRLIHVMVDASLSIHQAQSITTWEDHRHKFYVLRTAILNRKLQGPMEMEAREWLQEGPGEGVTSLVT